VAWAIGNKVVKCWGDLLPERLSTINFVYTLYLDLCCYNRPFDDQSQLRVRMETEAKLQIQARAKQKLIALVWSYVLDYENSRSPMLSRMESIALWRDIAGHRVLALAEIAENAKDLALQYGIKSFDALHLACSLAAKADIFVTTDDQLLRKLKSQQEIRVVHPIEALSISERWYESRN
jgi:predicted nucleic acid-binding protein